MIIIYFIIKNTLISTWENACDVGWEKYKFIDSNFDFVNTYLTANQVH